MKTLLHEIWSSYESLMKRDHWKITLTVTFQRLLKLLKLKGNSTTALPLFNFLIVKKDTVDLLRLLKLLILKKDAITALKVLIPEKDSLTCLGLLKF